MDGDAPPSTQHQTYSIQSITFLKSRQPRKLHRKASQPSPGQSRPSQAPLDFRPLPAQHAIHDQPVSGLNVGIGLDQKQLLSSSRGKMLRNLVPTRPLLRQDSLYASAVMPTVVTRVPICNAVPPLPLGSTPLS